MIATMATPGDFSIEDKRRLRVAVETYYDVQDVRTRTENRLRNYSEFEALVAILGEDKAKAIRQAGPEAPSKEAAKYKPTDKKPVAKLVEDLVAEGLSKDEAEARISLFTTTFEKAWAQFQSEDSHAKVNELARKQEAILKRIIEKKVHTHPLWTTWLSKVSGIGPCLAGGLLAWIDLTKAKHASSVWKYCGLHNVAEKYVCPACRKEWPADDIDPDEQGHNVCPDCKGPLNAQGFAARRVAGEKSDWNPKAKVLCYKIGDSFVKQIGKSYRKVYDEFRAHYDAVPCKTVHYQVDKKTKEKKVVPCPLAHKFMMAKRATVKIFLSHYYTKGRTLLGLPVSKPYPFGMLGHDQASLIEPLEDGEKGGGEKD